MNLQSLLHEAAKQLKEKGVEDPSREAGLLLSWALGRGPSYVYAHPDDSVSEDLIQKFRSAIKRRGRHEPYAYITGECEFLALGFEVNPDVLIPRPDTEVLAEAALAAMGIKPSLANGTCFALPRKEQYHVLDIGTGSGCLAVSAARYAELSHISVEADAVDISIKALETARRNALIHHVQNCINFIQADFLRAEFQPEKQYDLVLSNPPYIPSKDVEALMPSVRDYEPHTALDGGADGLLFYRALAEKAGSLLLPGGIMMMECGFDQASGITELFSQKKMETLVLKDLAGIDRVVAARKR